MPVACLGSAYGLHVKVSSHLDERPMQQSDERMVHEAAHQVCFSLQATASTHLSDTTCGGGTGRDDVGSYAISAGNDAFQRSRLADRRCSASAGRSGRTRSAYTCVMIRP